MSRAGRETEIKLALASPAALRRRLRKEGFRVVQPRSFEQNTLYDTPGGALRRRGLLLRLRSVSRLPARSAGGPDGRAGRHWLTFKGPSQASRHFKIRAEFETELADARTATAILTGLGYEPFFRYQKFRTVYAQRGGEAMLDETPIGAFVELEGPRRWIQQAARALTGAGRADFITQSYRALYFDWCRRRGRRPGDMVFSRQRRLSP